MASRVALDSSHTAGDFSGRTLTVRIVRELPERGVTRVHEINFEVPSDFHTHNDSVAAALMTLVGRSCPIVTFNFPISNCCADILRAHYNLEEVGPVDPSLEPRQRGRYLGLMLSGGLDSMSLWVVLRRVLGDEFRVITTEFGGHFTFEALGYEQFRRDVSCRTDFRQKGFGHEGRFTTAVPLLFADYADLYAVTTGHHYSQVPLHIESLREGGPPGFWREDRPLQAGGLDEVHIMRTLEAHAQMMLATLAEPRMLETAWAGSSPVGSDKWYCKGIAFRLIYQQQGRELPAWVQAVNRPKRAESFGGGHSIRLSILPLIKYLGIDPMRLMFDDIDDYDLSFLDDLTVHFTERYNTNLTQHIPAGLRAGILAAFHEAGILPFDENDYAELDVAREFQLALLAGTAPLRRGVRRSAARRGH